MVRDLWSAQPSVKELGTRRELTLCKHSASSLNKCCFNGRLFPGPWAQQTSRLLHAVSGSTVKVSAITYVMLPGYVAGFYIGA
jgi:hypothetical protein